MIDKVLIKQSHEENKCPEEWKMQRAAEISREFSTEESSASTELSTEAPAPICACSFV